MKRLRPLLSGSGTGLANPFLRGAIAHFYERWSAHHRLQGKPRRQPKALLVGGHVDLQANGFSNCGIQSGIRIVE